MNRKMKGLVALALAALCSTTVVTHAQIQYVPKSSDETTQAENKGTADDLLPAEQIVVNISEDGYVTSHGDHYHYYNGQVPYESIFSESLLVPKEYEFKEDDVVSEVKDGFIVKVGKKHLLYVKDIQQATMIRTTDELMLQSHDVHPKDAKAIVQLKADLSLADDTPITYEEETTYEEYSKSMASTARVVWITANEFVLLTDDGMVVFGEKVSAEMPFDERLIPTEMLAYEKEEIIYEVDNLKVIKHDGQVFVVKE
ncbi:pneumococcal-type histidine triad protein [Aerococcaceae bacterium zg-ZUI334]|uniref:pneumococcal-type histidine triad protein n=1 Tax=Aerococcaceae bacterium zg-252 TaxID=2796928 RepID=UPI001B93C1C7|nr:pneumococcal-type histidine triad protein [Aerococcaceae bacterium zg-ZUI334]MBS4460988.1 pneumococcal-type histidine triad protein [Aerococcaceae bacterium zg-B36]